MSEPIEFYFDFPAPTATSWGKIDALPSASSAGYAGGPSCSASSFLPSAAGRRSKAAPKPTYTVRDFTIARPLPGVPYNPPSRFRCPPRTRPAPITGCTTRIAPGPAVRSRRLSPSFVTGRYFGPETVLAIACRPRCGPANPGCPAVTPGKRPPQGNDGAGWASSARLRRGRRRAVLRRRPPAANRKWLAEGGFMTTRPPDRNKESRQEKTSCPSPKAPIS